MKIRNLNLLDIVTYVVVVLIKNLLLDFAGTFFDFAQRRLHHDNGISDLLGLEVAVAVVEDDGV